MPIFKKKPACTEKLERQQYLAKFEPTNVVNYAECDLSTVPSGTYSLCSLFLKEVLILHSNRLVDLKEDGTFENLCKLQNLRVWDLHNNRIGSLPAELGQLQNLQVLNLENNSLTDLCPEICSLKFLQTLNVKNNRIKRLPISFGDLASLRTLDISGNRINRLLPSMYKLRCLEAIMLDVDSMAYPPKDICAGGTTSILRFLCSDNNAEYVPSSQNIVGLLTNPRDKNAASGGAANRVPERPSQPIGTSFSFDSIKDVHSIIDEYERIKELKGQEMAKLQRDLLEQREKEALLVAQSEAQKTKLLSNLAKENEDFERRLDSIGRQNEERMRRAIQQLENSERSTKLLINKILGEHEEMKLRDIMKSTEATRMNDEDALRTKLTEYDSLRKAEIADAMEQQMRELCKLDNLLKTNECKRKHILEEIVQLKIDEDENLEAVLKSKQSDLDRMLSTISRDEELQKKALLMLMQDRDSRTNRINEQLQLIQDELARLTLTEMKNRDIRDATIQKQLQDQRNDLTGMMSMLVEERQKRNNALRQLLIDMEKQRSQEQADYWLVQYQRLLDMKPDNMLALEKELDDDVKQLLIDAHATIYLPIFAKKLVTIDYLLEHSDEHSLEALGVHDVSLQQSIQHCLQGRINDTKGRLKFMHVSASPVQSTPTVQAHCEVECVVCLERPSSIVFIPCGHVCCCHLCQSACSTCPLCRRKVEQRIDLSMAHLLP